MIERRNDALGPIAAHGYTCTAVARVSRISLPGNATGFAWVHARPDHLEIVRPDGGHETMAIRDASRTMIRAVQATVAATLLGVWLLRRLR